MSSLKLAAVLTASSLALAASARLVYAGCSQKIEKDPGTSQVKTADCDNGGRIVIDIAGQTGGATVTIKHPCVVEIIDTPQGTHCAGSSSASDGCEHAGFDTGTITIKDGCRYDNRGRFIGCGSILFGYPKPYGHVEYVKSQTCPQTTPTLPLPPTTLPAEPAMMRGDSAEAVTVRDQSRFDQARLIG